MVWGWVEPNSCGDYFPKGDFGGWEEAIKRYFDEDMSSEQRAAFDNWDVSYRGDVARKFREDRGLVALHERPSAACTKAECPFHRSQVTGHRSQLAYASAEPPIGFLLYKFPNFLV